MRERSESSCVTATPMQVVRDRQEANRAAIEGLKATLVSEEGRRK